MARAEFLSWLHEHGCRFRAAEYEPYDVVRIARACGFTMADIAPDVVEWLTRSRRQLALYRSPFRDAWIDLYRYQRGRAWDSPAPEKVYKTFT